MGANITVNTTGVFYVGTSKSISVTIVDSSPDWVWSPIDGKYKFTLELALWSSSSSGTKLESLKYLSYLTDDDNDTLNITQGFGITIDGPYSDGTYYIGDGTGSGTRDGISVETVDIIRITYDINGGIGTTPPSDLGAEGTTWRMPDDDDFSRPGYTFLGWSKSSVATTATYLKNTYYVFNDEDTLYAVWSPNLNNVVIDENGGGVVANKTYITDDEAQNVTISIPTVPLGKTFLNWTVTIQPTPSLTSPFTGTNVALVADTYGHIEIKANWSLVSYSITYNLDGGTGAHGNPATYNVETPTISIVQGAMLKTGYLFSGWFTAASGGTQITSIALGSTGNRTLYAQWVEIIYLMTFKNDYAEISEEKQQTSLNYNDPIVYAGTTPVKVIESNVRYVFIGWNTDKNAVVALGSLGNMPDNDYTLYAIYDDYLSAFKTEGKDVNIKAGEDQAIKAYKGSTVIWEDFH